MGRYRASSHAAEYAAELSYDYFRFLKQPLVERRSLEDSHVGPYDRAFDERIASGVSVTAAAEAVAETYLDGKPLRRGKHRISRAERDAAFWTSAFLTAIPAEAWQTEPLVLALARYLGQERVSNTGLLEHVAVLAPTAVRRAVRYSGLVLTQHSPRRTELDGLAAQLPHEFTEFLQVLDIFDRAHRERLSAVEHWKVVLADLSPLEFLVYASLHAFEHWVPRDMAGGAGNRDEDSDTQSAWDAVNDLLLWKLATAPERALRLTEDDIGRSLKAHLSPFLFPSVRGPAPRRDLREAFEQLLAAQIELNSFVSRSAEAFSYDDGIRFVLNGSALEIVAKDPAARAAWVRDGEKLDRLHGYWWRRALEEFVASSMASWTIGTPGNHEANRVAYIQAVRTRLRLTEVYGLGERVTADSGKQVDLFQALLSLELMSVFFNLHFLAPFTMHLSEAGDTDAALGRLAFAGLLDRNQIRFPLTWSDRAAKISSISGWTVSAEQPGGSASMAGAILDFWSSDWAALAARLRKGETGLSPDLFERPVLKLGQMLVQLPWVVAVQNNSTAAINNLRRLGARRGEAGEETRRIEQRLGQRFEARGFRVVLNWHPPVADADNAGEVDLICSRDGRVLVLEVKSTYLRRTLRDAWLHRTTTLRKAGLQLRRKVEVVRRSLALDSDLAAQLGTDDGAGAPRIDGWIVDTSIECDHQRFCGFLKVSLEEVLIALRDDRHLLNDPDSLLDGSWAQGEAQIPAGYPHRNTLYPEGFSASRFVEVVKAQAVWDASTPEK